jgi:hypothetical protein
VTFEFELTKNASHNNVLEIESGKCASQANFLADGTFNSEEVEEKEEKTPAIIFRRANHGFIKLFKV